MKDAVPTRLVTGVVKACQVAGHQDIPLLGAGPAPLDGGAPGDLREPTPPHLPVTDPVDPRDNLPERLEGGPSPPPASEQERWATGEEIEGEGLVLDPAAPEPWRSEKEDVVIKEDVLIEDVRPGAALHPKLDSTDAGLVRVGHECRLHLLNAIGCEHHVVVKKDDHVANRHAAA